MGFLVNHRGLKFKLPKKVVFRNLSPFIVILTVLLAIVFVSSMLVVGLYGSTNDDGADHTLMIRIILDNPNALISRSAGHYANFYLRYPLASHVASAFFVSILNVQIQKIVLLFSATLPSLIALAFYSTVKSFFENKLLSIISLLIAGFFTIGLFWGPIGWAGLPLLMSFFLSTSGMGFIYVFLIKDKISISSVFLLGSILFVASRIYPVTLLFLTIWFLFVLGVRFVLRFRQHSMSSPLTWKNGTYVIVFLVPILFTLPYFYFNLTHNFSNVQEQHLVLISSWSENIRSKVSFNWLLDLPSLSAFFTDFGQLLSLVPLTLIIFIVFFAKRILKQNSKSLLSGNFVRPLLLIYVFMLTLFAYLTFTLNFNIDFFTAFFDPQRVWAHIFIPAVLLTSVVIFSAGYLLYFILKRLCYNDSKRRIRIFKKVIAVCLLVLFVASLSVLSNPIVHDQQVQYDRISNSLNNFGMMGKDDLALMYWIKQNIALDSNILVSASDSGQYVTSVTQRQTISMHSNLGNYSDLVGILSSNASDLKAIPLLEKYNVSYVYIGSKASTYALEIPHYRHFNSSAFLETTNFVLIKQFGDAWLFRFNQPKL